ncbi:MAG: tRNA pseudouridine(55) synthase TruB [Roseiflexaceae bacterium]
MHGFLCINKTLGRTSHDMVAAVRRITRTRAVGHAGTLDPAATGVLVIALGMATRLIEYIQDDTQKTYRATICLGSATDSDDATGATIATANVPQMTTAAWATIAQQFTGTIAQVPPAVSALHHNGERMYELVRRGVAPTLASRQVHVHHITIEDWQPPYLTCTITCGKGTYIRAIARDMGESVGSKAHLCQLERTAVGDFVIADAITTEALQQMSVADSMLPLEYAVRGWHHIHADAPTIRRIQHGQAIPADTHLSTRAAVINEQGKLVAVVVARDGHWHPHKVFHTEGTP